MRRFAFLGLLLPAAALAAAPVPKEDDAARLLRVYGVKTDPGGDARFELRGDALRIVSPARELPEPRAPNGPVSPAHKALWAWQPTPYGAVRVWREVTGDFTAVARVSFPLRPPAAPDERWQPRVAGLVVWSGDKDHFGAIRCETQVKGPGAWRMIVREAFQSVFTYPKGMRISNGELGDPAGAARLRVVRTGTTVSAAFSRDGAEWTDLSTDEVGWERTVKVGVYAKHFTGEPFEATFDEYTLTVPKK